MRWKYRILISLAALIALVVIIVQIVLWSSIPKNLVTSIIENQLGLRITTDRLTTGWLGRTTLSNVSLGLPLSDQSFLGVQTLKLKHTSLFGLLFGRSFDVQSIELDHPTISVRQDANGQWNVAEVAQLLARAGGSQTAEESQSAGVPKLPTVRVINGVINVSDNESRSATLPLAVEGDPSGRLVWRYNVRIADSIKIVGEVAPGSTWQHQVVLRASHLDPLLKGWGIQSYNSEITARWNGRMDDGKMTGRLTLEHYTATAVPAAGKVDIGGAVDVQSAAGTVTVLPRNLHFDAAGFAIPNLGLSTGTITIGAGGVQASQLQLAVLGGLAVIDGKFDPNARSADVTARWSNLALPQNATHSGSLVASLRTPFEGHPNVKVNLISTGRTNSGGWEADIGVDGRGQSWQAIDWSLSAPTLRWNGPHPIQFTGLSGHVIQRGPQIELSDLTLAARPHLVSRGAFNLDTHNWYFWLDAGGVEPTANELIPISLAVNSWGNDERYELQTFNLTIAQATVWAGGSYDRRNPNPVNLDVYLTQAAPTSESDPMQGHLGGSFHIAGYLFKEPDAQFHPHLDVSGSLKSSDLVLLNRPIGDINAELTGVDDDGDIDVTTSQMTLLQGAWKLEVHRRPKQPIDVKMSVENLPIEEIARVADVQKITGQLNADWDFSVPLFPFDFNRLTMESSYKLVGLNVGTIGVDELSARISLWDGYLKLNSLTAKSGTGQASADAAFNLNDRSHLAVNGKVDRWSFGTSGGAVLQLSGNTKLDIDFKAQGATGATSATAELLLGKSPIAHADIETDVRGRIVNVSKITGNILDGNLTGLAVLDLDHPLETNGYIHWSEIDADRLIAVSPAFKGLGGRFSGAITVGPARDPRPLEPLRFDVNIAAENGHYKSLQIGEGLLAVHAVGYANTHRAVLDHSDIRLAGGMVHLWARVSEGLASEAAQVEFDNIQLDQIAHLEKKDPGPTPGLVTGRFTMLSSGGGLSGVVGNGSVQLTQSDLGNFGPITALYSALNLSFRKAVPSGAGSAMLSIEQNVLRVSDFHFYNRGVDAFGHFLVGPSFWNFDSAPIGGQVAGAIRPLKNSSLAVLSDLDEALSTVQPDLTAINLRGTGAKPIYEQASLAQLGSSLREILGISSR